MTGKLRSVYPIGTYGPLSACQGNGVLLAGQWWPRVNRLAGLRESLSVKFDKIL